MISLKLKEKALIVLAAIILTFGAAALFYSNVDKVSGAAVTGFAIAENGSNETIINDTLANESAITNETGVNETAVEIINETLVNETSSATEENVTAANVTEVNATATNETAEEAINRTIAINLEYKTGSIYDTDNDGSALTTEIIDFTVENTQFNWPVSEENLCTRWTTYSVENDASNTVCYGSASCCSFVDLSAVSSQWNEPFLSAFGQRGATPENIISAQVLYVDYDLTAPVPFAEIYNSEWQNLTASYLVQYPRNFRDICIETCSLSGFDKGTYTLIFEIENAVLKLDSLAYIIGETIDKYSVGLSVEDNTGRTSGNFSLYKNGTLIVDKFVEPSYYDIEVIPEEKVIDRIVFHDAAILEPLSSSIGVDNVSREIEIEGVDVQKRYAIDPSGLEFRNATLTATAEANSLFKCKDWNYQTETCLGEWEKIMDLTVGEQYNLTITKDDPGFIEGDVNVTIKNVTPEIISKKKDFKLGEDIELDFEYFKKEELMRQGKWKDEYDVYEETTNKTEGELEILRGRIRENEVLLTAQEKAVKKQAKKWQRENETVETFILDSRGQLTAIKPEIEELREGKFRITIPEQRAFRPGKYTLKVDLSRSFSPTVNYTIEQDFTWGVLAINVNKSIYLPNEDSFIGIGVLDDEGHMVCNASVTLEIINPLNQKTTLTTTNGDIKISPECEVYGVTDLPDYYTDYSVSGVGAYLMNLTALTANGVRNIQDNFSVQSAVDYDVARQGPTRIYPFVPYNMSITINANKNYNGVINEYAPAGFNITPQAGLAITTVNDTKILSWNVNLKAGNDKKLYYSFYPPDISP